MPHQRNVKGLLENRGKRPRLDHQTVTMRMSAQTRKVLEALAARYGCFYAGKPHIGTLLAKVSRGEILMVPAPPPLSEDARGLTQEDEEWLNADLSRLGEYEPYDWEPGELEEGEPFIVGEGK
jgi:hypothetical protein